METPCRVERRGSSRKSPGILRTFGNVGAKLKGFQYEVLVIRLGTKWTAPRIQKGARTGPFFQHSIEGGPKLGGRGDQSARDWKDWHRPSQNKNHQKRGSTWFNHPGIGI